MYLIESNRRTRLPILMLVFFLGASVIVSPSLAFGAPDALRSSAAPIDLGATVRGAGYEAGTPECFRAEMPGAGLLLLEVAVPVGAAVEPRLGLLSPYGLQVIERTATYLLALARAAERFELCVGAQDPARRLGEYRLDTRFAGLGPVDASEEEQLIELEPEGLRLRLPTELVRLVRQVRQVRPLPQDHSEEEQLIELEPEGLRLWLPGALDHSEEEQLIELEPEGARAPLFTPLCGTSDSDDHGDALHCSTLAVIGEVTHGEIANDWGDDRDVFALTVTAAQTVRIRTTGGFAARGGLYDRNGHLLATAEGRHVRLVRTLTPGLYFFRLEGMQSAEGEYALTVDVLERPW